MYVAKNTDPKRKGGFLASLDDLASLTPFEIDPLPPGTGPDEAAMGSSRWLWRFAPAQLTTLSNIDGSGFTVFAKVDPANILGLGGPTSTGPSFLFDVLELPEGGGLVAYIGRSDGVGPFEKLIDASSGSYWVGAPMFAHSHIGWLKGINPVDINKFEAVELWASPYSEDPAQLAPYKVGDLVQKSWAWMCACAGWARYATIGKPEVNTNHDLLVWDLEKKTNVNIVLRPIGTSKPAPASRARPSGSCPGSPSPSSAA